MKNYLLTAALLIASTSFAGNSDVGSSTERLQVNCSCTPPDYLQKKELHFDEATRSYPDIDENIYVVKISGFCYLDDQNISAIYSKPGITEADMDYEVTMLDFEEIRNNTAKAQLHEKDLEQKAAQACKQGEAKAFQKMKANGFTNLDKPDSSH